MEHIRRPASKETEKPSFLESTRALRYLPRFFSMIWKTSPSLFLANIISRLFKSALPVTMLWLGKLIIDEVVLQSQADAKQFQHLYLLLGLEFGLAILSDLLSRAISLTDGLLGDLYANKSSVELIKKAATMDLAQFEDPTFYDKLERARRQTVGRVSLMTTVLFQMQDLITIISLLTGLIVFEPWLVIILIIAIIPSFINEAYFSRTSYSLIKGWTPERRELDYIRFIGASDATAKEIKLFGLANFLSKRFSLLADKYYYANKKLTIRRSIFGSIFHIIGDMAYYGAYLLIIFRTVSGLVTLGDLTFLSGAFSRLRNQLQEIFSRFSRITEDALYLQDYFAFMEMKPLSDFTGKNLPFPNKIKHGFRFENVGFQYPSSDRWIIRNLNFELKAGEKLALVGENGAGKTTLVKLLTRLYEPTEGTIYLDDIDIREYEPTGYHEAIGVIFQDYVRYYFTAEENIAVGHIEDLENQKKIEQAAVASLADQVVEK
ncbi:MAG: ABC transporter ATP-binding protein, partial [Saprospiraceae bacterium]|nr:ABC transporter ATP-binding protein [Saprospiraceae bacterium]